jgi:hypothetical protein
VILVLWRYVLCDDGGLGERKTPSGQQQIVRCELAGCGTETVVAVNDKKTEACKMIGFEAVYHL